MIKRFFSLLKYKIMAKAAAIANKQFSMREAEIRAARTETAAYMLQGLLASHGPVTMDRALVTLAFDYADELLYQSEPHEKTLPHETPQKAV